jgi:glycosyltransferase involved in cell wall biosynthesis
MDGRDNQSGGDAAPELSIVVPVFNEAASLEAFFNRLDTVLDRLGLTAEVVCIDDGSSDHSWHLLTQRRERDPRLRLVRLSRNFGKDITLACGLAHARGQAVIPIDADLQHPPEVIPEFVEKWRAGFDMVYGIRRSRQTDSRLRRWASVGFYKLFARVSDLRMPEGAGDFRLIDRRIVDILNQMPERARFNKGLFTWVGFQHVGVDYDIAEREAGGSTWSLHRLVAFAIDGLASFSTFPLVISGYVGAALALPSLLLGGFFVVRTLILGIDVPGYASVMVAVLILGSIQLLTLGLFGAYLGRVFEEVKRRPLYVVSDRRGFDDSDTALIEARQRAAGVPGGGHLPSSSSRHPAGR